MSQVLGPEPFLLEYHLSHSERRTLRRSVSDGASIPRSRPVSAVSDRAVPYKKGCTIGKAENLSLPLWTLSQNPVQHRSLFLPGKCVFSDMCLKKELLVASLEAGLTL